MKINFTVIFTFFILLTQAQSSRIFFNQIEADAVQDFYITPDEKLLLLKTKYVAFGIDIETQKRMLQWNFPKQQGYVSGLDYSKAFLNDVPNNFVEQYGLGLKFLTKTKLKKPKNVRFYNVTTKKWTGYPEEDYKFIGYGPDGKEISFFKSATYQLDNYGKKDTLIQSGITPYIFGYNQYIRSSRIYHIASKKFIPVYSGKFSKNLKYYKDLKSKCYPEYYRRTLTEQKKRGKLPDDIYYDLNTGQRITPNKYYFDCKEKKFKGYVSKNYIWEIINETITDSTGTYNAILLVANDKKSGVREKSLQLNYDIAQQAAWDSGATKRLNEAVARREARKQNAIAAAKGEEKYTGYNALRESGFFRKDGGANVNTTISESLKVDNLANYLAVGDELLFFPSFSKLIITDIDYVNNILVFGKPGNTIDSQNAVHYYPMNKEVCRYKWGKSFNKAQVTCTACNGGGKRKVGVIPYTKNGDWKLKNYENGEAIYKREVKTLYSDVIKKCRRCNGSGSVSGYNEESNLTYECLNPN